MAIKSKTEETTICDLCGKQMGVHLTEKDFYEEAPTLVVENHAGVLMEFQLNLDAWPQDDEDTTEESLGDVINMRDMLQTPQQQQMPMIRIMQNGVIQQPTFEDEDIPDQTVVCKKCYTNLVKMITTYGKFDKIEKF